MAATNLAQTDRQDREDENNPCAVQSAVADKNANRSPKTIAEVLQHQMRLRNVSHLVVARALGATDVGGAARKLWRWSSGKEIPRQAKSLELLAKLEKYFGLSEGHFAEILAKTNLSYTRRPCNVTPFQTEFAYQMNRHCDSCQSLARAVAETNCAKACDTFANWKTGRSRPRSRRYDLVLNKVERRYGLDQGHFKALLAKPRSARLTLLDNYPERYKSLVRWHLPVDFDSRSPDEQKEIVNWISSNVVTNGTKFGRYQASITRNGFSVIFPKLEERSRSKTGPRLAGRSTRPPNSTLPAPDGLAAEMRDYVTFKTASLPPVGFRRFLKWSAVTAKANILKYGVVFGALVASPSSPTKGYGVQPSDLTFGVLAFPRVWDWYLRWREQRRGFFSTHEASVLFEAKASLRRPTGWIRQHPELAHRVKPIEGLISEEELALAQANWDVACERCIEILKELIAELRRVERHHRDGCEAVLPILNSDSPLAEYKKIVLEIQKHMSDERRAPFSWALSVRSYLLIRFGMHLGFRQRNLRDLLLCRRGDKPRSVSDLESMQRGEIRWSEKGGGWEVFAPAIAFKNSHSSFFRNQPFKLLLPDSEGLYEFIEAYICRCRATLLSGRPDPDTFFVRSGRSSRLSTAYDMQSFYQAWKLIIQRYGIYNPYTGRGAIPELLPHGSQALRGVIATHVLKQTGSYELASFAIQDTVETVIRCYARFLPHEKVARAAVVLNKVWRPSEPSNPSNAA